MIGYLLAHSNWDKFEFNKTLKSEQELINEIRRDLPGDNSYSLYVFNMTANDLHNTIAFINSQTHEGQDGKYSMKFYQNVYNHLINMVPLVYKPACRESMEWIPN